jgi:hypothetical protein
MRAARPDEAPSNVAAHLTSDAAHLSGAFYVRACVSERVALLLISSAGGPHTRDELRAHRCCCRPVAGINATHARNARTHARSAVALRREKKMSPTLQVCLFPPHLSSAVFLSFVNTAAVRV